VRNQTTCRYPRRQTSPARRDGRFAVCCPLHLRGKYLSRRLGSPKLFRSSCPPQLFRKPVGCHPAHAAFECRLDVERVRRPGLGLHRTGCQVGPDGDCEQPHRDEYQQKCVNESGFICSSGVRSLGRCFIRALQEHQACPRFITAAGSGGLCESLPRPTTKESLTGLMRLCRPNDLELAIQILQPKADSGSGSVSFSTGAAYAKAGVR